MAGKDTRFAEEIDYIQDRAAEHDSRLVTGGPLVLFSTETGDAMLLDLSRTPYKWIGSSDGDRAP